MESSQNFKWVKLIYDQSVITVFYLNLLNMKWLYADAMRVEEREREWNPNKIISLI